MDSHVYAAVLLAALLHAGWNSVLKIGLDRLSTVYMLSLVQAAIAIPILPFIDPPTWSATWPWLVLAAVLHTGYKVFLIQAYAHADLSQAYPLARGTAPLIVAVVSAAFLGTQFTSLSVLSIALISGGVIVMAVGGKSAKPINGRALFYAFGTAAFTASYTLADGMGARASGSASAFILWMVIGDAIGMTIYTLTVRKRSPWTAIATAWKPGLVAGAMSLGSYWIAIWAFTVAPIALVAALRESSILFAVLIAAVILRENVTLWRWISAAAIAVGVITMKA
ncbi:EamA family transporter [Marivivens niveibacter]|uniref:EamA family transporter n=1 Tax=Marivivens niveibacter TaxID=1930667 RepID=A0A251WZX2_9RHOB|nr:EamA family transporter [Marivivens niveibacter]OUD10040.1 EamA family transporter [Marivivens niveibacter]